MEETKVQRSVSFDEAYQFLLDNPAVLPWKEGDELRYGGKKVKVAKVFHPQTLLKCTDEQLQKEITTYNKNVTVQEYHDILHDQSQYIK